jgi:hypothetical protein
MFERLRCMSCVAALPSGQTCNTAVRAIIDRHPDVRMALDRTGQQQRERQP